MKKIELIEFLKGYSILSIVFFHYLQSLQMQNIAAKLIAFGGTGVHLFVLLSGFGLYYSHLHKPISFLNFLNKRITKIYFPYIVVVLLSALISLIIPIYKNSWYALGGHIFLYKMFDETIIGSYGYPLWFISMIIQFYLCFTIIVKLKTLVGNNWFIVISFILSALWIIFNIYSGKESLRVWNSFFLRYIWEFSIGMILADLYKKNNYSLKIKFKTIHFLIIGVINCILYAALALKGGEIGKMTNDVPALIGYSFIAIWVYLIGFKILNRFILYIGKVSYSVYLLHTLIQMILIYYVAEFNIYIALALALLIVFFLAEKFQKTIDKVYKLL